MASLPPTSLPDSVMPTWTEKSADEILVCHSMKMTCATHVAGNVNTSHRKDSGQDFKCENLGTIQGQLFSASLHLV